MGDPSFIDPVEYGELLASVRSLTKTIEEDRADRKTERADMKKAMDDLEGRIADLEGKLKLGKMGVVSLFLGIGIMLFGAKQFLQKLWDGLV